MKFFTKREILWVLVILALLASASLYNFRISLRRSRDAQRKADLGQTANALGRYQSDFGFYPPSLDGKIVACEKPGVEKPLNQEEIDLLEIFLPCEWGEDGLRDVFDPEYPAYLKILPVDTHKSSGASYTYVSIGNNFQLYTSLEGKDEDDSQKAIRKRNIACGTRICNYGKAPGATPLDKSLEEYENELLQ